MRIRLLLFFLIGTIPLSAQSTFDPSPYEKIFHREHLTGGCDPVDPIRKERALRLWIHELAPHRKQSGLQGLYSRADVLRARQNIQSSPWARAVLDLILRQADFWAGLDDEFLYALIPTKNPRAATPSQYHGCPIHGGNRLTLETSLNHPYRYHCVAGGEWWYDGVEVKNPKTGDSVVVVDTGSGWVAPPGFVHAGETYYFHGAYRLHLILKLFAAPYGPDMADFSPWMDPRQIREYQKKGITPASWNCSPAEALAYAFVLTGKPLYAHKAGVWLNRIAEIYPHLNGSKEGYLPYDQWKDPIRGYVSEASGREQLFLNSAIQIYDLIYEGFARDQSLADFFARHGSVDLDEDGAYTVRDLCANVERNLFSYGLEFIDRSIRLAPGDFLMSSQGSLLRMAAVMDSPTLIDRLYHGVNNFPLLMVNSFFRDGRWWYDSAGYAGHNAQRVAELEEWLQNRTLPINPYLANQIVSFPMRIDCDGRLPLIGDTTNPRSPQTEPSRSLIRLMALKQSGMTIACDEQLPVDCGEASLWTLFHASCPATEPPANRREPASELFPDSGFAILRTGQETSRRKHIVLNFGKGCTAHGHMDKLAINIISDGYDLSADIGYPASWIAPKFSGWELHSLSHATVLIDQNNQQIGLGSLMEYFPGTDVQVVEAEAPRVYPHLAKTYRRGVVLVEKDSRHSYLVDVFRVQGGREYDYSFHSLASEDGTGMDVRFDDPAVVWQEPGRDALAHPDPSSPRTPGYGWLVDVKRAITGRGLSAKWRIAGTDVGIVLHMTGEPDTQVFAARGEGAGNEGTSPWDPYMIVRRQNKSQRGQTFVAVYEPFHGEPVIQQVQVLQKVNPGSAETGVALAIRFHDGDSHLVFIGNDDRTTLTLGKYRKFRGRWGWCAEGDGRMFLGAGRELKMNQSRRLSLPAAVTGRVRRIDQQKGEMILALDRPLPNSVSLEKRVVLVDNPRYNCRSSYTIEKAFVADSLLHLRLADADFILSRCQAGKTVSAAVVTLSLLTPLPKVENFPGLFDGKVVQSRQSPVSTRLVTAQPGKFVFAARAKSLFPFNEELVVWDVGPGDRIKIPLDARTRIP
jgi:hypothetical protein